MMVFSLAMAELLYILPCCFPFRFVGFNEENKQGIPVIYCGEELLSFSLSGE